MKLKSSFFARMYGQKILLEFNFTRNQLAIIADWA